MVVSLLPAGIAEATTGVQKYKVYEDGTLEYGFYVGGSYGWSTGADDTDYQDAAGRGNDVVVFKDGGCSGFKKDAGKIDDRTDFKYGAINILAYGIGGYWAAAVEVPTAGTYEALVGYSQESTACNYEFYLVPITDAEYTAANVKGADRSGIIAKIDAAIANGETLGNNNDNISASKYILYNRLDKRVDLNAGKYMFVSRCIGGTPWVNPKKPTDIRYQFYLRGLILEPVNKANPTFKFCSPADTPIEPGNPGVMTLPGGLISTATMSAVSYIGVKADDRNANNGFIALGVDIPTAGTYKATIGHLADSKRGIANYFLVPASVASDADGIAAAIATEDYYIGTIDGYSSTEIVNKQSDLSNVTVSAGKYYLVAKIVGKSSSAAATKYDHLCVNSLTLTAASAGDDDDDDVGGSEPTPSVPKYSVEDDGTITYGFYIGGSYGWDDRDADYANAKGAGDDVVVLSNKFAVSGFDLEKGKQSWVTEYTVPLGVTQYLAYETGNWGAIQIEVPTAGTYSPLVGQYYYTDAGNYDYYLVPVVSFDTAETIRTKVNAAIASGTGKLGSTVGNDTARNSYIVYDRMENKATLNAGKYMFVAVCTGGSCWKNSAGTESRYYLYLRGLVLEPFDAANPTYMFRSPADTPVIPGSPVGDVALSSKIIKSSVTTVTGIQTYGISCDWRSDSTGENTWIALDINVANSGWYAPTISYTKKSSYMYVDHYLVPKSVASDAASIEDAIAGDASSNKYYLGQTNNTYSTSNQVSGFELDCYPVNLTSGDYCYVAKIAPRSVEVYGEHKGATAKNYGLSLDGISLTATEEPKVEITNAAVFGDIAAYTKKTDNGIVFIPIAGIDSVNYKEVGFYVGDEKVAVVGGNVYKSITAGAVTANASDFFTTTTPSNAYAYYVEKAVSAGEIEFTPYAIGMDDVEIKGYTYSVTIQ